MDLVERLRGAIAGDLRRLPSAAAELFTDRSLDAELAAAPVDVAREWDAFERVAAAAWSRFPALQPTGAHGSEPDPRAAQLFATLTYARGAGCYSAAEIAGTEGAGDAWMERESLRLRVLLAAFRLLVEGLDSRAVPPSAYADAIASIVAAVSRAAR